MRIAPLFVVLAACGASTTPADGGAGGAGGGSGPSRIGIVLLYQDCTGASGCTHAATAAFRIPAGAPDGCTRSTVGPCLIEKCSPPNGTFPDFVRENAGALSITSPLRMLMLTYSGDRYGSVAEMGRLWNAGDEMTVTAAGATVPAFSAKVTAPGAITVTKPVCSTQGCGAIDRTAELAVEWTGGGAAEIQLTSRKAPDVVVMTCDLASSPARLPIAALSQLGKSSDGWTGSLTVFSNGQTRLTVGDYAVTVDAHQTTGTGGTFTTPN